MAATVDNNLYSQLNHGTLRRTLLRASTRHPTQNTNFVKTLLVYQAAVSRPPDLGHQDAWGGTAALGNNGRTPKAGQPEISEGSPQNRWIGDQRRGSRIH